MSNEPFLNAPGSVGFRPAQSLTRLVPQTNGFHRIGLESDYDQVLYGSVWYVFGFYFYSKKNTPVQTTGRRTTGALLLPRAPLSSARFSFVSEDVDPLDGLGREYGPDGGELAGFHEHLDVTLAAWTERA